MYTNERRRRRHGDWTSRLVMAMPTPWCIIIVTPAWINLPPENLRSARKLGRAEIGARQGSWEHCACYKRGTSWLHMASGPRGVFIWWIEKFGEVWQIKPWSDEDVSRWTLTMIKRGRSQWHRGQGA